MDGELLSLKWNNHRTTFLHVIGSLRSKATYTDATLACEGKFYPVHRLVLSTCSEYFGAIFEKTPCKCPVIVLKDIECKNLEFLLDYMYIGEVNVRQNELASLIRAAECLRIKGLAVPDEDPSLSSSNSTKERLRSDSHRESSPPAKRRRSRHFSSDEKRSKSNYRKENCSFEESLHNRSKFSEAKEIINNESIIKLEPTDVGVDSESEGNFAEQADDNDELRSEDGGGAEENNRNNTSNDLVEFFKETVEKEEPISLSDYSSDFAGPSGAQNSNNAQWDNENSFPSEALSLDSSNNSAIQADSQNQQQMWKPQWNAERSDYQLNLEEQDMFNDERHHIEDQNFKVKSTNHRFSVNSHSGFSINTYAEGRKNAPSTSGKIIGLSSFQDLLDSPFQNDVLSYPNRLTEDENMHINSDKGKVFKVTTKSPKIHQCDFCSYSTMKKSNFVCHRRIHTGEKPFKCLYCSYCSNEKARIKIHQRRHTGEKPYKCNMCDYKASSHSGFKQHLINKHFVEYKNLQNL